MLAEKTNTNKIDKIIKSIQSDADTNIPQFENYSDYLNFTNKKLFPYRHPLENAFYLTEETLQRMGEGLPFDEYLDLCFLIFTYYRIRLNILKVKNEKGFFEYLESPKYNNEEGLKEFILKYKYIVDKLYREVDLFGIFSAIDEVKPTLSEKIIQLKNELESGKHPFINKIDFIKMERIFYKYVGINSYINLISPDLEETIDDRKGRITLITDRKKENDKVLSSSSAFKKMMEQEKEFFAPKELLSDFNASQQKSLSTSLELLDLFKFASPELFLEDLKDTFEFNNFNRQKTAEILFSLLQEIFIYNHNIELLSFDEWEDDQDREDNIVNKRYYRKYMERQVLKYLPGFDKWG